MPEESKSWPFSSYDFFGYLMPGLIFLILEDSLNKD